MQPPTCLLLSTRSRCGRDVARLLVEPGEGPGCRLLIACEGEASAMSVQQVHCCRQAGRLGTAHCAGGGAHPVVHCECQCRMTRAPLVIRARHSHWR